jgi:hypothetical protein
MDAKIASLWRGGDLSTMSSGTHSQGRGSNRQEDEAEIILDDDVTLIDETINAYIVKYIIEYKYGVGTPVLVRYATIVPPKEATAQDLTIDQFLVGAGAQLSVEDAMKRYGRVAAKPGETLLTAPKQDEQLPAGLGNEVEVLAKDLINAQKELLPEQAKALEPVSWRIRQALALSNDDDFEKDLVNIINEIPDLLKKVKVTPARADHFFKLYKAAYLDGITTNPSAQ